jgi:glutaminyl-peptide cyclotransferase
VLLDDRPLGALNELEWARGRVYANVWHSEYIFAIDPATGRVVQVVDCADCIRQAGVMDAENVLNGIAYDVTKNTFYITGKNWPVLFEVSIPEGK